MRSRKLTEDQIGFVGPALAKDLEEHIDTHPQQVIASLSALVSETRQERIDKVIAHRTRELTIVLDHVSDPHNAAAVLRTAEGFGLQEVHTIQPSGQLRFSRRVTQGCHKWLDVAIHKEPKTCLDELRRRGFTLVAATEHTDKTPEDYRGSGPIALCMGNEHEGLCPEVLEACQGTLGIPMVGFSESLNVSVATALIVRELRRERMGLSAPDKERLKARYYALSVRGADEVYRRWEKQP